MDKFLNITTKNNNKIPIIKLIAAIYILLISNYLINLNSKKIICFINNNKYIQHIILFSFIYIILSIFNILEKDDILKYTFFIYLWLILIHKVNYQTHILIFFLLIISLYVNFNNYILFVFFIIIFFSSIMYNNKKYIQYGCDYNNITYIL